MNIKTHLATLGVTSEKFVPRLKCLQQLNGTTIASPALFDLGRVPAHVRALLHSYKQFGLDLQKVAETGYVNLDGRDIGFGKFLKRLFIKEEDIDSTCKAIIPPRQLTISTRYKDFLNVTKSKHYASCSGTSKKGTMLGYLQNPRAFLLLARDKQGEIESRFVCRLIEIDGDNDKFGEKEFVVAMNKCYGVFVTWPSRVGEYRVFCDFYASALGGEFSPDQVRFGVYPQWPTQPRIIQVRDFEIHKQLFQYGNIATESIHDDMRSSAYLVDASLRPSVFPRR